METQIVTGTTVCYRDAFGEARSTFGSALRPRFRRATADAFGGLRIRAAFQASTTPTPDPSLDVTSTGTS